MGEDRLDLDLNQQRLPLAVGAPVAVRSSKVFRHRWAEETFHGLMVLVGLAAAAGGATLALIQPPVSVNIAAGRYTIGDVDLRQQQDGTYSGPAGSLAIIQDGAIERAGASTTWKGRPMQGHCDVSAQQGAEDCWFVDGGSRYTAHDVRTRQGWLRRYSDGIRIEIDSNSLVPVPFPVGR